MSIFKKFSKTKEDFICEQCGHFVKGNGYTNHCPKCLWSKHVDINPGDRNARCQGMMEPVGVEVRGDLYIIHQKCIVCGHTRQNKSSLLDAIEKIITLSSKPIQ